MIRIAALIVIALSALLLPTQSIAWKHGNPLINNCAFSKDNGCAAAATAQLGSVSANLLMGTSGRNSGGPLNLLSASATNYAVNGPNTNLPNIEYAAG